MSYPKIRYTGDTGEISARFRPAGTKPDYVSGGRVSEDGPTVYEGTGYHYLGTDASTGGEFGLYRVDMGPRPTGPAAHFHRTISESFFILSGTVRLFDGEGWIDAMPGDFLYVPVGGLHGFRNESGEPASMLLLFAPGASREEYFEGIDRLGSLSEEQKAQFYIDHDNHWI